MFRTLCMMWLRFLSSSASSQDVVKDQSLRDDLNFYFMNPCEKYQARQHIPWKLGVQILKIVLITAQVRATRKDVMWSVCE